MKKMIVGITMAVLLGGLGVMVAEAQPNYNSPLEKSGVLEEYDDDFYVNGVELELGQGRTIGEDYNQDGVKSPIKQELRGLVGKNITVKGYLDHDDDYDNDDELYVTEINGLKYPNSKVHNNHR